MGQATLFVGGDVLNYHQQDGKVVDSDLENIVRNADYAVCNFEAPVSGSGTPIRKSGPHHAQRPETVDGLKDSGFDLLLLANNHIMDYGCEGLQATIERARIVGIDTLGAGFDFASAYRPMIKSIGGVKIGMINACEAQFGVLDYYRDQDVPGYAWIYHREIDNMIDKLKYICDFVVVFAHAGLEHYSIPQKEWRTRYKALCDCGANVVIGSHPHVPQGYEYYNESLIFYSLGNLYFDSNTFRAKADSGFSVVLTLSSERETIDFDVVYHYKEAGKTKLAKEEVKVAVEELNALLVDAVYKEAHDEMCLQAYSKIVRKVRVAVSRGWYVGDLTESIKRSVRCFLLGRRALDKNALHLHLVRNEAYHFAVRHALEVMYERRGGYK